MPATRRKTRGPHASASRKKSTANMAGTPYPNNRIVPVIKKQGSASSKNSGSRSLRQQLLKGEILDTDALKIQCLEELRLYAAPIKGDGNCLFYSLSDQLYGYPDYHEDIRQRLVDHVRDRADYFMQFVSHVGGERRAPRRAAAAAMHARKSHNVGPVATDEGQRAKFEQMLSQMGKNGFWGGSVELQAFCQAYGKDVMVYSDHGVQSFTSDFPNDRREERQTVHVAYHSFEHYSSVRSVDGPHTGFPKLPGDLGRNVCDRGSRDSSFTSSDSSTGAKSASFTAEQSVSVPEPWKISSIAEALPEFDHDTIKSMLAQCRWDINAAFSRLLDGDGSAPPSDDSPPPATNGDPPSSPTTGTREPRNHTPGQDALPGPIHRGSSSRSSSRHSTASKRSANESDDDDDSEPIRSPIRRRRCRGRDQKRRVLQDVTVGISVRDEDDENDVISIQLRVDPNTMAEQANSNAVNGGITEGSPARSVSASNGTGYRSDAEVAEGHARDHYYSGRSPLSFGQNSEAMTDDGGGSEYEDHAMASDSDDD